MTLPGVSVPGAGAGPPGEQPRGRIPKWMVSLPLWGFSRNLLLGRLHVPWESPEFSSGEKPVTHSLEWRVTTGGGTSALLFRK